ncbi:hypothetical protein CRENBAI_002381 [Crenichthys baileyi]|uniref:Uncharacterized protein n=1 Tax=Crenichthys baileyi TaxID=28760 RepID=A0AAV9S8N6_9TELE
MSAAVTSGTVVSLLADVETTASIPVSLSATSVCPRLAADPPAPSLLLPTHITVATPDELEERLRFYARQLKNFRATRALQLSNPRQAARELLHGSHHVSEALLPLQSSCHVSRALLQSSPCHVSRALLHSSQFRRHVSVRCRADPCVQAESHLPPSVSSPRSSQSAAAELPTSCLLSAAAAEQPTPCQVWRVLQMNLLLPPLNATDAAAGMPMPRLKSSGVRLTPQPLLKPRSGSAI